LHAGRAPRADTDALTLRKLVNVFMSSKRADIDAGRRSPRTFSDYHCVCDLLIDEFGATRAVSDIRPLDFEKLYNKLAGKYSLATVRQLVLRGRGQRLQLDCTAWVTNRRSADEELLVADRQRQLLQLVQVVAQPRPFQLPSACLQTRLEFALQCQETAEHMTADRDTVKCCG